MKRTGVTTQFGLATLALATLIWSASAGAQTQSAIPQDNDANLTQQQLSTLDQFLDSHPDVAQQVRKNPSLINNEEFVENHPALQQYLQAHPEVREGLTQNPGVVMRQEQRFDRREDRQQAQVSRDQDLTRGELSDTTMFLDNHPEIEEQIKSNPSLVNDKQFVASHPALQQFLTQHPQLTEEFRENPNAFMTTQQGFDLRQDAADRQTELAGMNQFLGSHPEIAEQARKNPSLLDNGKFVSSHPALQQFLAEHPRLQSELRENPNGFMAQENQFAQQGVTTQAMGDRDMNGTELANMNRFMESHPEIAEQLRKNPSLVSDKRFVNSHPELREFLSQHPGVRGEFKENPKAFMQAEQSFDRREDANFGGGRDVNRGELSSFHEFLEGHGNIATELSKNPSLSKNEEYLENHPALQAYLQNHPQARTELNENPGAFLKSAQSFEMTTTTGVKGTAKTSATDKWK